jgi:hypothetical protein
VARACIATAAVHLALITRALGPDEGGFSLVARYWNEPGPHLYGPLWVDRPPGLIALFWLANHLGPWGVRLMVTLLAVTLVALAGACATEAGGRSAGRWAAWTAFALGSTVLLQAQQLNGEYAAIVCVAASIWLTLRSLSVTRSALIHGAAAGIAAAAAVTMKQNFLDGFVFAALLLGSTAITPGPGRRRAVQAAAGMAVGAIVVGGAVWWWSLSHGGPEALAEALYGFRAHATEVMERTTLLAPAIRMVVLLLLCLASGLLVIGAHVAWQGRRALRDRNPLAWAIAGTVAFELTSLVAGANFWPHYALAFIPIVALGAGLGARRGKPGWAWTRRLVIAAAVATAVISPAAAAFQGPGDAWATGRWVARSAHEDDTIVVPYSHANVVHGSGLRPAYPYLWSLPIRTLDPHLKDFTASLVGPRRATWVVVWNDPKSWGLDQRKQLGHTLLAGYTRQPRVCGHVVWLRSDADRQLARRPSSCGGGAL